MRALLTLLALAVSLPAHAGPLNDTGITFCGNDPGGNTAAPCTPNPAGQDKQFGRDAAAAASVLPKTGGGEAGFDFSKVCMSGETAGQGACPSNPALGTGANDWACTKDNVTGLIWEVKTDDGGLRDKDNTYTNWEGDTLASNSIGFLNAVNALSGANRLCGATDWRRPSKKELLSIVHFNRVNPSIEPTYFPNTPSGNFWSGSPSATESNYAWYVNFNEGYAKITFRGSLHVRLVRGGQ